MNLRICCILLVDSAENNFLLGVNNTIDSSADFSKSNFALACRFPEMQNKDVPCTIADTFMTPRYSSFTVTEVTLRLPTAPAPKTEVFNALPLGCRSLQRVQGQTNLLEKLNLQQHRCAAPNRIFLVSQTTVGTGNVRNVTDGGTYQINSSHAALTFRATNICVFKTIITHCTSRRLAKFKVSHVCNEATKELTTA